MTTTLAPERTAGLDRLRRRALAVGAVALAICAVGAFISPAQFARAYLSAYLLFVGVALGSLAVLMLYHLTGGAWGFLIRRILEAQTRTLPLLTLLFIPVGLAAYHLYPWARPDEVARSADLQHKRIYLNVPFFWVRAVLFFALWNALAYFLNAWSRRQDQTGEPGMAHRLTRLSAVGLPIYGVTITFASVDWVMSLQPGFRSTIFGPLFASGEILTGHACALVVLAWLVARPPLADRFSLEAFNDLGNLLFTFVIIWSYMGYFQFMLVWIANLPYDVSWYVPRLQGGWKWVAWALVVFQFAVPFILLLMRDVKRDPLALAKVAGLVLFMQLVYEYFQVLPAFGDTRPLDHWMDFLTPVGLGGLWLAYFLWQLPRVPVLPAHDLNEGSAVRLRRHDVEAAAREQEVPHAG